MSVTFTEGNDVALLKNGADFFPALEAQIHAAKADILIETYIYVEDDVGTRVSAALRAAAARGVRARLLVDGIGARAFVASGAQALRDAGVEVRVFKQDHTWFALSRSRLRRLHRKVATFDGQVAFVGGINIVSDFAPPNSDVPQFDLSTRIVGPLVQNVLANSMQVWHDAARADRKTLLGESPAIPPQGEHTAAFVFRDNFRNRRTIEKQLRSAIASAEKEVLLANAYFLPGWKFRGVLRAAAKRGVVVRLVLQGHTDHIFLRSATRYLYARLLKSGVYIAEYERSMLHAKACVVDGQWASVGSSNLDPFSLLLAREANVVVKSAPFAQALRTALVHAIEHESASVAPTLWDRRPWVEKCTSALTYATARLGVAIAGLGAKLGA